MVQRTATRGNLTAFKEYLLREEKSAATVEKYLRDVRAFMLYAEGKSVSKELVVAYKASLEEAGYKPRSINSMLAGLNAFLDFLGLGDCKVKNLRVQRATYIREEKELTKDEYKRLLAAVRNGDVSVRCKSKTRTIIVPGDLRKLLLSYANKHGITDGVIFVTRNGKPLDRSYIWEQMKALCGAAGVNPAKVFPHNLRKLFARTFYGIEKDIAKLADILGHSSIETTRIYIMTTGSEHRRQIESIGLVLAVNYV